MANGDMVQLNSDTMQLLEGAATMGFTNTPNIGDSFNFAGRTVGVDNTADMSMMFAGPSNG